MMNALMRVKRGGGLHVAIGVAMLIDRWVRVRGSFACWSAIGPRCSISPLRARWAIREEEEEGVWGVGWGVESRLYIPPHLLMPINHATSRWPAERPPACLLPTTLPPPLPTSRHGLQKYCHTAVSRHACLYIIHAPTVHMVGLPY